MIVITLKWTCTDGVVLIDREVLAISPKPQSKSAVLPLKPTRNLACTLRVQVSVVTMVTESLPILLL